MGNMNEEQPKIEGKIMPFENVSEGWNEYNLADGNTMLIKHVLISVLKTDKKDPMGVPIYNVKGQVIVNVYTKEQGYLQAKR